MLSRSTFLPATIVAMGIAFNHSACIAQAKAEPAWNAVTITRVKPDMVAEFERCVKKLMSAYKRAGALWFITFETFAGDMREYTTVSPVMKFGDLDDASTVTKVLSETGGKDLIRRFAHCYTSQTRMYATPQLDLEIRTANGPLGVYWVDTKTLVAPGKMDDYLNWLKNDYRPALEKAGVTRFQVSRPIFGATAGEVVTMRMLKNLAEIDAGAVLSRALSDQQVREIASKSLQLVSSSYTRIVRMRSDLSYAEQW